MATETIQSEVINFAYKGDWEKVKRILNDPFQREKVTTDCLQELVMITALRGPFELFKETLKHLKDSEILAPTSEENNSILHLIATISIGDMKYAKAVVDRCPPLTQATNSTGHTPLFSAVVRAADKDLVWYLTLVTTDEDPGRPFSGPQASNLIAMMIAACYYDIVHFLLQRHPSLAESILSRKLDNQKPVLAALASRPLEFRSGTNLGWLGRCIYPFIPVEVDHFEPPRHVQQEVQGLSTSSSNHRPRMQISMQSNICLTPAFQWHKFPSLVWSVMEKLVPGAKMIRDAKLKHEYVSKLIKITFERPNWNLVDWSSHSGNLMVILGTAASCGIIEFLHIFLKNFPYEFDPEAVKSLAFITIHYRQDKVFNFLFRNCMLFRMVISYCKDSYNAIEGLAFKEYTSTLHMVAELTHCAKISSIAGAAFQMQRELQWFKGMERLDYPLAKDTLNIKKDTPWVVFKNQHRDMRKEGEKWMKSTSNSCMLVATLISTVVFAAAFTVPGGNNQEHGTPIFLQKNAFMLFAVFDALALFLSINSLWMFLSILTARFTEEDFLKTLPKRLIFGLASLFLAIVSTITAFCAALSLVLGHREKEVIFLLVLVAFSSVATFLMLQLPLFFDMVRSTYGPSLLVSN